MFTRDHIPGYPWVSLRDSPQIGLGCDDFPQVFAKELGQEKMISLVIYSYIFYFISMFGKGSSTTNQHQVLLAESNPIRFIFISIFIFIVLSIMSISFPFRSSIPSPFSLPFSVHPKRKPCPVWILDFSGEEVSSGCQTPIG